MKKFVRKKKKVNPAPQPEKKRRTYVCSFRLRDAEINALQSDLKAHPVMGINSTKQFTRKLAIDYSQEKLVYGDARDRLMDPSVRSYDDPVVYDCTLPDKNFVRAVIKFLGCDDHYRRLRLFMLQFGWPPKAKRAFRAAKTENERMDILLKVLSTYLTR